MDSHTSHPIQVVARRTGLSADVIRAWERRYQAIEPHRAENGRRQYSDADIEKLNLLRRATGAGRRIGDVANLTTAELYALIETDESAAVSGLASQSVRPNTGSVMEHFEECLDAVNQLDPGALKSSLVRAANTLGIPFLLEDLLRPLIAFIRDECRRGAMRQSQEQMATALVRSYLCTLTAPEQVSHSPYKLIVTTPLGQLNDLIALRIAVAANAYGWSAVYLGTNLPSEEIGFAADKTKAAAVALGLARPTDDPYLPNTLRQLRQQLHPNKTIIAVGSAVSAYSDALTEIGAVLISTMGELRMELDRLRKIYGS